MQRTACNAIGCRAAILPSEVFCARHLLMVESDTRRVLRHTLRPRQRHQSDLCLVIVETALREILLWQTCGYKVPRDQPFEWDDPLTSR